jgi:hypothetical protein
MRHVQSLEQAREIVRSSIKTETLLPYATAWDTAFVRLSDICSNKIPVRRSPSLLTGELTAA